MKTRNFKTSPIARDLKDSEFAAEYLKDALQDGVKDFVIALRNVADTRGGIASLSEKSKLGRESLYKTLTLDGSSKPYFSTIYTIIQSLDLELAIKPKKLKKKAA